MNGPKQEDLGGAELASGWSGVWGTVEGWILASGMALTLVGSLAVLLLPLWAPDPAQPIIAMSLGHLAFGRAAAISIGYAQDLGHAIVIGVNLVIEIILVLVLYPLFVLGYRRLPLPGPVNRMMTRARSAARIHQASVRRFGALGLAFFVWLPFWMTGPVVGSFIGYLVGMPVWLNLGVVIFGTALAIIGWSLFLSELTELMSRFGTYGPLLLVASLIAAIVVARVLRGRLRGRDSKL